ncbi:hypothetical protein BDZ91DRAFT_358445 [Kalaharituber pfeilii]|nr:hypothetical protein BDZ91DRAFT_358445 [Kalaharituber pfeilii]
MAPKKHKKRLAHPRPARCRAITRSNDGCIFPAINHKGKQRFCAQHTEEYRILYLRYKELQTQLEELTPPEVHSVGGTGRVKAFPISKAEVQACRQKPVLESLRQYYRTRHGLVKRNIEARKWFMKHFHAQDEDWGHRKAIQDLQVQRVQIADILFSVEKQYNSLSLPHQTGDRLGKWQDAVKDKVRSREQGVADSSTSDRHKHGHVTAAEAKRKQSTTSPAETQHTRFVKPMEQLTVFMMPPEEEPDPLAAALAARRQELLGDFWYFLKYRFCIELEPWLDFIRIAECIFRRIVLATPGALELSHSHSAIRSFLEDETISIDILDELWDLMQECPPSLVWDAISDYRTFINTQFENHRDVSDDEKVFLLGGFVHLAESSGVPSSSPAISWYYLSQFSYSCCIAEIVALARSFQEALTLHKMMEIVPMCEWTDYWEMIHGPKGS